MTYFPAFIKLDGLRILVIGGGKIAGEKIEKLLDFSRELTVIAPKFSATVKHAVEKEQLACVQRHYLPGDIEGFDIVIVAVDDLMLQKEIYEACRGMGILCNSVDSLEYCNFIFPSYTKRGPLTIAFSTSGISPSLAKYLRRAIEKIVPDSIVDFLEQMRLLRITLPKGKTRMQLLDEKAESYVKTLFEKDTHVQ